MKPKVYRILHIPTLKLSLSLGYKQAMEGVLARLTMDYDKYGYLVCIQDDRISGLFDIKYVDKRAIPNADNLVIIKNINEFMLIEVEDYEETV